MTFDLRTLNPLRTLTGRMVLVTVLAVMISNAIGFAIFAHERGASMQRVRETVLADRIAYTYQRLEETPAQNRAGFVNGIRDFGIDYSLSAEPLVTETAATSSTTRLAESVRDRLGVQDVRVRARLTEGPPRRWETYHRWREEHRSMRRDSSPDDDHRGDRRENRHRSEPNGDRDEFGPAPIARYVEVSVSSPLDGGWMNATTRFPAPRSAPLSLLISSIATILAVGIGAALISWTVGRPLSQLAGAARRLGSGETNVTAPVHGPEDVRRASTAFNVMAERLGRQLNRQRQMLWALSHDLRTPITALRLRAELVEDDATRQRLLAPLAEMEALTEQALSLARAGASEEPRSAVDLAEIARTLCGELQDLGVNIISDAPAPVIAECRPSEVARAMRNLAENAARYGGGGIMHVRRQNGDAVIEVTDEGPGVPASVLARLAEPFFRAESARSESDATGAGLGLAIAQAIADTHGGKLVLANRSPRGFSATLSLPAEVGGKRA